MEIVKRECRFYRGDRPCRYHKATGTKCADCSEYAPAGREILVVKLDALGDVLRTTSILPGLRRRDPGAFITWITRAPALPLFVGNDLVDRVLPLQPDGLVALQVREFDLALNLDTSPLSAGLLSLARAREKVGFDLDERGRVRPLGEAARELLETSVFDDLKRANRRTYQEIVSGIVGLEPPVGEVVLKLLPAEREAGRIFAIRNGLDESRLTVGVNTGGGGRWKYKRWTEAGTVELIRRLRGELDAQVVLFGGPEEEERNARVLAAAGSEAVNAGCRNSLRGFFSRLALADILVTSDTMALHAALGLGKKVVALFGPTSGWEIELYGRGERVVSPVPCQCCYLNDCEVSPDCMESITAERVMESLVRLL